MARPREPEPGAAMNALEALVLPPGPISPNPGAARRGWFVVFEGTDGTGKSTQASLLAERTGALLTRQPGGTRLGGVLRDITLGGSAGEITDRAEALLMAADRAQHVETVIEPALLSGQSVVCDRYLGSSIAYQGYGRGLSPEVVATISRWACDDLLPDVVVYLTLGRAEAQERMGAERDRIEAVGDGFRERVEEGFEALAASDPTWVTVDGSGGVEQVANRVGSVVLDRLEQL